MLVKALQHVSIYLQPLPSNSTRIENNHGAKTFANAGRYPKAYPAKSIIHIHTEFCQFLCHA